MKYIEAIGNRLGELLKAANCSQSQFAQDSKISRTTINRTIKGRVNIITFETLIVFCKTLDITLKDFFASSLFDEEIELCEKKRGRRINL